MDNREIRRRNLKHLIKLSKSIADLAHRANTNANYLSQLISDKPRGRVGDKLARQLEQATNRPAGWLDRIHSHTLLPEEAAEYSDELAVHSIPIIPWDNIKEWLEEPNKTKYQERIYINYDKASEQCFAMRVRGDAMRSHSAAIPSFTENEIIIIDPNKTPLSGDYVIAFINNNSPPTFKQYVVDGNHRYLKPLNEFYKMSNIDKNTHICGVVIAKYWFSNHILA